MASPPDSGLQEALDAVKMDSLDSTTQKKAHMKTSEEPPTSGSGDPSGTATAGVAVTSPPAAGPDSDEPRPTEDPAVASGSGASPSDADSHEPPTRKEKGKETATEEDQIEPKRDSLTIEPTEGRGKSSANACLITLLLPTGARHPYRIDEKYLAKRNIKTPEQTKDGKPDPFSISVYTLKELVLREWRDEWDTAPASPGSIRLIFFGKMLDDRTALSEYNFSPDAANIVHMTIRPPEIDEEDPAKGTKAPSTDEQNAGCGCCVVS